MHIPFLIAETPPGLLPCPRAIPNSEFRITHVSLDSMIYTPPFLTAMKATFPVISLETAN